jgi:hypothetical protein
MITPRAAKMMLLPVASTVCLLAAAQPLSAQAAPVAGGAHAAATSSQRAGSGAKLKADYRFDGNLKSSVSGAPRLRNVGSGNSYRVERVPGEGRTKVLVFPKGNGLRVNTKGLIPSGHYSVVMQFRLVTAGTAVYARILNPTLAADDNDNGLYLYNKHLLWYDETGIVGKPGTVAAKKFVEVAFTRSTAGRIRVYVNGAPDISYADADSQGVIQDRLLRFFVDNSNDEASKGAVSRIRLYNDALRAKQVKKIYAQGH